MNLQNSSPNQTDSNLEYVSADLLTLARRKLALRHERLNLLKRFGLLAYRPHAKQELFHRAANYKRRMVRAGNRFGKSLMGCAEDLAYCYGERVWMPKDDPARKLGIPDHPVKILVITTDFDVVDSVWTSQRQTPPGKIWQLMPEGFVKKVERNSSGVIDHIFFANGSSITWNTVKSFQNDPLSLESVDWDCIHVDEPCPEAMWKAAARGLIDRNGTAWFTLTPLREMWINDMFFPRRLKDSSDKAIQQGSRWAIQGATRDNTFLTEEAIAEFEATLTKDERECRLKGLPLEMSGLIYKDFDWDRHVLQQVPFGWRSYAEPPRSRVTPAGLISGYTVYVAIDPHPQTPHAVLFCAVSPENYKFFWREIFEHTVISHLSSRIIDTYAGYYVADVLCDPLAYINDPITGTNIADEFANNGIVVTKSTKDLSTGILRVQEELRKENNLFFSPELEETLWEIERYVWDEKTNKPVDENDHMMENLYRLILRRPVFIDQATIHNRPVEDMVMDGRQARKRDLEESV